MAEWVASEFYLPKESADKDGLFDFYYTPYLKPICEAFDDPAVKEIVCMKGAQVAWTTILIAYICMRISRDPCVIVGMFAKEGDAKSFSDEKFAPTIRATPEVSKLVDVTASRKTGNRALFKNYPGGFIKLVGSNSPGSVKSTPADVVFVEEPDDANIDLKKQGDSILMLWERTKRKAVAKRIMGGTPSVKGLSRVEEHINHSDKRVFMVPCHDCGESHVLGWENVSWLHSKEGEVEPHVIYGLARPDTATYNCPECGSMWDDETRKSNVRNLTCVATAPFTGVAGFMALSEMYSCLPGASLSDMVLDHLNAEHKSLSGDESAKVVFVNSKLGMPYEYTDKDALPENLAEIVLDYKELVVPYGAYAVTAGVDVQHDRLAIVIRAYGPDNESWLIYWGEIYAKTGASDPKDPVWSELSDLLFAPFESQAGYTVPLGAVTIDSSDGQTNDVVYDWDRRMTKKHKGTKIMSGKGSSATTDPEIFRMPTAKSIDHSRPERQTKADRKGVKVFMVGTNKAKDLISARLRHEYKEGAVGIFHVYKDVRADYFDQMLSEIKAPHRSIRGRNVWQVKSGARNEALDCEVYALHASRAIRLHLLSKEKWGIIENNLKRSIGPGVKIAKKTVGPQSKPNNWISKKGDWI